MEEFLKKKIHSWQVIDELLIIMKLTLESRLKNGPVPKDHFHLYKQLKDENDSLRDLIVDFALKNGFKLVPIDQ